MWPRPLPAQPAADRLKAAEPPPAHSALGYPRCAPPRRNVPTRCSVVASASDRTTLPSRLVDHKTREPLDRSAPAARSHLASTRVADGFAHSSVLSFTHYPRHCAATPVVFTGCLPSSCGWRSFLESGQIQSLWKMVCADGGISPAIGPGMPCGSVRHYKIGQPRSLAELKNTALHFVNGIFSDINCPVIGIGVNDDCVFADTPLSRELVRFANIDGIVTANQMMASTIPIRSCSSICLLRRGRIHASAPSTYRRSFD